MNNEFKLKGKKFYLIYKNINKPIDNIKERILEQLKYKFIYIDRYLIGQEKKNNGIYNIHCFIELNTEFETTSTTYFDMYLDGIHIKGDYNSGKRKKRIVEYILQLDNYIYNLEQLENM